MANFTLGCVCVCCRSDLILCLPHAAYYGMLPSEAFARLSSWLMQSGAAAVLDVRDGRDLALLEAAAEFVQRSGGLGAGTEDWFVHGGAVCSSEDEEEGDVRGGGGATIRSPDLMLCPSLGMDSDSFTGSTVCTLPAIYVGIDFP